MVVRKATRIRFSTPPIYSRLNGKATSIHPTVKTLLDRPRICRRLHVVPPRTSYSRATTRYTAESGRIREIHICMYVPRWERRDVWNLYIQSKCIFVQLPPPPRILNVLLESVRVIVCRAGKAETINHLRRLHIRRFTWTVS